MAKQMFLTSLGVLAFLVIGTACSKKDKKDDEPKQAAKIEIGPEDTAPADPNLNIPAIPSAGPEVSAF